MKYILNEREYEELLEKASAMSRKARSIINELCKDVATYKPTFKGWSGDKEARPWGCRHVPNSKTQYCDHCPVKDKCGLSKHYSK